MRKAIQGNNYFQLASQAPLQSELLKNYSATPNVEIFRPQLNSERSSSKLITPLDRPNSVNPKKRQVEMSEIVIVLSEKQNKFKNQNKYIEDIKLPNYVPMQRLVVNLYQQQGGQLYQQQLKKSQEFQPNYYQMIEQEKQRVLSNQALGVTSSRINPNISGSKTTNGRMRSLPLNQDEQQIYLQSNQNSSQGINYPKIPNENYQVPEEKQYQPVTCLKKAVKQFLQKPNQQSAQNSIQLQGDNFNNQYDNLSQSEVIQQQPANHGNQKRRNLLLKKPSLSQAFSAAKRQAQLLLERGLGNHLENPLPQSAIRQMGPFLKPKTQSNNYSNLYQKKLFLQDFYNSQDIEKVQGYDDNLMAPNISNQSQNSPPLDNIFNDQKMDPHFHSHSSISLLSNTVQPTTVAKKIIKKKIDNMSNVNNSNNSNNTNSNLINSAHLRYSEDFSNKKEGSQDQQLRSSVIGGALSPNSQQIPFISHYRANSLQSQAQQNKYSPQIYQQVQVQYAYLPSRGVIRSRGISEAIVFDSPHKNIIHATDGRGFVGSSPIKQKWSKLSIQGQAYEKENSKMEQQGSFEADKFSMSAYNNKGENNFMGHQLSIIKSSSFESSNSFQGVQEKNMQQTANMQTSNKFGYQSPQDAFYTCFFLKGNNSGLVKRVLLTRSNWKESSNYSCNLSFRWHPFSKGIKFENLSIHKTRVVNHFEFHDEITTKNGLIRNLSKYCCERGRNIFDFTPCTFLLSLKEKHWEQDLIKFCEFFYKYLPEPLQNKLEYKKIVIDIKGKFRQVAIKNIKRNSIPHQGSSDKLADFKIYPSFFGEQQSSYLWLLKPTNLNRGRGIELFSDLNQLETLLSNYFEGFYEQPIADKVSQKENKEESEQEVNKEEEDKSQQVKEEVQNEIIYPKDNNQVNPSLLDNKPSNQEESSEEDKILATANEEALKNNKKGKLKKVTKLGQFSPKKRDLSASKKRSLGSIDKQVFQEKIEKLNATATASDQKQQDKQKWLYKFGEQDKDKSQSNDKDKLSNSNNPLQQSQITSPQPPQKDSKSISAEFGGCLMKEHSFVIQKYIERPFLINQRKFDIRMWVVVSQNLDVYLFKEGYIRTSSKKFDLENQDNIFIHLTNNAIQKYSDSYGQFESGNQLSLNQFDEYLKSQSINKSFRGDVMPRIKEIIIISMLSVKNKLNMNERKFSFEIFGYDFFIDAEFNVWLIEVNTNPCIEESSPLLAMLIPRMIDDALKLTLDLIFPPTYSDEVHKKQKDKNTSSSQMNNGNDEEPENIITKVEYEKQLDNEREKKPGVLSESLFPVDGYSSKENMFGFLVNLYKTN